MAQQIRRLLILLIALAAVVGLQAAAQIATPGHADQSHWAFRPSQTAAPPMVKNSDWPRNSVDHFILAALEARQLSPSTDTDKRTLLKRASFDLIGLPPTPGEL